MVLVIFLKEVFHKQYLVLLVEYKSFGIFNSRQKGKEKKSFILMELLYSWFNNREAFQTRQFLFTELNTWNTQGKYVLIQLGFSISSRKVALIRMGKRKKKKVYVNHPT